MLSQNDLLTSKTLTGLDTYGRFSVILYKGDIFCNSVLLSLHIQSLLKKGLH